MPEKIRVPRNVMELNSWETIPAPSGVTPRISLHASCDLISCLKLLFMAFVSLLAHGYWMFIAFMSLLGRVRVDS